mmetsp:Transcript_73935/g.228491  ORF Transcript_73935/g.228491 Transcript_73935/m.228491 type:complete len:362 (-) Transcript_73935:1933-3018(-)
MRVADLERALIAVLVLEFRHLLIALPFHPGAGEVVLVFVLQAEDPVLGRRARPLPGDGLLVGGPAERDLIDRAHGGAVLVPIDEPVEAFPVPVWPNDLRRPVSVVDEGMDGLVCVLGAGEVELLPLAIAEGNSALVDAVPAPLHLLVLRPGGPRAANEDGLADRLHPGGVGLRELVADDGLVAPRGVAEDVRARVRPAEAKGRDAAIEAAKAGVNDLRVKVHGEGLGGQVRVHDVQVAVRRGGRDVDHHDALAQARDARTRLQVRDVALRAGLQERELALVHDRTERSNLNGVAERGARAVALGDGDRVGVDPCEAHGLLDDRLLGRPVGCCQAGTPAVLVRGCADEGTHALLLLLLVAIV